MFGRTAGIVALGVFALSSQALLLPPNISNDDIPTALFSGGLSLDPHTQNLVILECSDCAFPLGREHYAGQEDDEQLVWIQETVKGVQLNFTLSENGHALTLHGKPIYPMLGRQAMNEEYGPSMAEVVPNPASRSGLKPQTFLKVTGERIDVDEGTTEPYGTFLTLNYRVMSLEHQKVMLDTVQVAMFEIRTGELMITEIKIVSNDPTDRDTEVEFFERSHDNHKQLECKKLPQFLQYGSLCKMLNSINDKAEHTKAGMFGRPGGCHGKKLPGHLRPHFDTVAHVGPEGANPHHDHPHGPPPAHPPHFEGEEGFGHHHGHHGPHHHRHHHLHFLHKLARGIVAILTPVLVGITFGMAVSFIGMLSGRFVRWLWIRYRRGGQRGYASVAQAEEAQSSGKMVVYVERAFEVTREESSPEEPLPVYEDAPAYSEKEAQ